MHPRGRVHIENSQTIEEALFRMETILEEAARLVDGPRQRDYGHPIDDFTRTGRMWGAMLGLPDIPPRTVAVMMVAVKLSREMNTATRDNLVDMAGYARTAELVTDAEKAREARSSPALTDTGVVPGDPESVEVSPESDDAANVSQDLR